MNDHGVDRRRRPELQNPIANKWLVVKIRGPFWGPSYNTAPSILGDPKGDHNFDNRPETGPNSPQQELDGLSNSKGPSTQVESIQLKP